MVVVVAVQLGLATVVELRPVAGAQEYPPLLPEAVNTVLAVPQNGPAGAGVIVSGQGGGGVQRKFRFVVGITVFLDVQEAVFEPPGVVADQFVVVVRLLKSAFVEPRSPTSQVSAVVFVIAHDP